MAGRQLRRPAISQLGGRGQPVGMLDQCIAKADPQLRDRPDIGARRSAVCRPHPRCCRAAPALRTSQPTLGRAEIAEESVAGVGQRQDSRSALPRARAIREGRAGPVTHSPTRRAGAPPRQPSASPRARRAATAAARLGDDQTSRTSQPISACASLIRRRSAMRRSSSNASGASHSGQAAGSAGRLVADPGAIALDQPGADRRRLFARRRSAAAPGRACRRQARHRNRRSTGPGRRGNAAPASAPAPAPPASRSGSCRSAQ